MTKLKNDFKACNELEKWYDLREDWDLIEASIAKQYNIRIRHEKEMCWSEFCVLVQGLMFETPLGQITSIRAEKNREVIKNFTPEQRKLRNDWALKQANKKLENKEKLNKDMDNLTNMFKTMFAQSQSGEKEGKL